MLLKHVRIHSPSSNWYHEDHSEVTLLQWPPPVARSEASRTTLGYFGRVDLQH